jgi:ATP adenylyltransferase/5',5'''-P-1,P-4-tetraphosphate phosphorylase II
MGIKYPKIEKFSDTPFEQSGQDKLVDEFYYVVYNDKWPVCDGHLLFVPKENNSKFITIALQATVHYGDKLRNEG